MADHMHHRLHTRTASTAGADDPPGRALHRRSSSMGRLAGVRPSARSSMLLGTASLGVCILSFIGQTVVTRRVQETYAQPYFILWISHSLWIVLLPLHTAYEKLKRRPRSLRALRLETLVASAKLIVQRQANGYEQVGSPDDDGGDHDGARVMAEERPGWVVWRTMLLATALAGLLNASAYLWYVAVGYTSMSKVTAIYNMSCFFAYLFSILLLGERVRLAKCLAVAASILGVALMALADTGSGVQGQSLEAQAAARRSDLLGDLLALICACGIGLYQVLYKRYAVPRGFHSLFHVNFMTALLGLGTLTVYWTPLPLLSVLGVEPFRWPDAGQAGLIATNALFGVAYNGGFMIALALTSPLFAAVGVMLTIPVMAVVDMAMQGEILAWNVFVGGAAILTGFSVLTLAEYRDTVGKAQDDGDADEGDGDDDGDNDVDVVDHVVPVRT
ncbi:hypothetical protein GGI07_001040 [Coemansia sp. Benny D115]|nr:hypothetical protein GGI07_001040 [Coemansia sp. Benny D115]